MYVWFGWMYVWLDGCMYAYVWMDGFKKISILQFQNRIREISNNKQIMPIILVLEIGTSNLAPPSPYAPPPKAWVGPPKFTTYVEAKIDII